MDASTNGLSNTFVVSGALPSAESRPRRRRWSLFGVFRLKGSSESGHRRKSLSTDSETSRPLIRVESRKTVNPLFGQGTLNSNKDGSLQRPASTAVSTKSSKRAPSVGKTQRRNTRSVGDCGDQPPRPPPRPSLKYKKHNSPQQKKSATSPTVTPNTEMAEIMEEVARCTTEQLDTAQPNQVQHEHQYQRNEQQQEQRRQQQQQLSLVKSTSREPTDPWKARNRQSIKKLAQSAELDPRMISPLRAKSVRLASRPLPKAPTEDMTGHAKSPRRKSQKRRKQQVVGATSQRQWSESSLKKAQKTRGLSNAACTVAGLTKRNKQNVPKADRRERTTLLRVANSSNVEEEKLYREQAVMERIAKLKKLRSLKLGGTHNDTQTDGGDSVIDDTKSINKTAKRHHRPQRQNTGKWSPSVAHTQPVTSVDGERMNGELLRSSSSSTLNRKRRQGTGRWEHKPPVAQTAIENETMSRTRKRQGTGKWAPGTGSHVLKNIMKSSVTTASDRSDAGADEVLNKCLELADAAWAELAEYRGCPLTDVAHDSQLTADEGSFTSVPSWRLQQVHNKQQDKLKMMTPRQKRRHQKSFKKRKAQQRQIDKLIQGYLSNQHDC